MDDRDATRRRPVHMDIITVYFSDGWDASPPSPYQFLMIYTSKDMGYWNSYTVESIDYMQSMGHFARFDFHKAKLKRELRHALARHLGVKTEDVRKIAQGVMWCEIVRKD